MWATIPHGPPGQVQPVWTPPPSCYCELSTQRAVLMAKRSATFKQFLLRVHPDHFRSLPRVHDENLQSIQLLNQFMDERGRNSASWPMMRSASEKKVHFSVYLPPAAAATASTLDGDQDRERKLKRFSLALSSSIESRMSAILRECGVIVQGSEQQHPQEKQHQQQQNNSRASRNKDYRRGRERTRRYEQTAQEREQADMDFGSSMHDMYEKLRTQNLSPSRHRKPILSMKDFLPFMMAEQTQMTQQQRYNAWLSIQSVKKTLQREFGIAEVCTSCGWASVHLNATLMVLLKTLRKYTRARGEGSDSLFTSSAFLHEARVDISSQPSGVDFNDEYKIHLNPTDVPLQWIEVLERVDDQMRQYMQAARESLELQQSDATAALAMRGASIVRGHTCSAMGYRAFLQAMAYGNTQANRSADGDGRGNKNSVLEKMTLVVEDSDNTWRILKNGNVQAPCDASFDEVSQYLISNRESIRQQRGAHEAELSDLKRIVDMCTHALGVKSVTHAETIPVAHVIAACEELLKLAAQVSMGTVDPRKVPADLYGGGGATNYNSNSNSLSLYMQGRRIRINRSFGLDQDGHFTIPYDWYK